MRRDCPEEPLLAPVHGATTDLPPSGQPSPAPYRCGEGSNREMSNFSYILTRLHYHSLPNQSAYKVPL